jgi:hypothetical protein
MAIPMKLRGNMEMRRNCCASVIGCPTLYHQVHSTEIHFPRYPKLKIGINLGKFWSVAVGDEKRPRSGSDLQQILYFRM